MRKLYYKFLMLVFAALFVGCSSDEPAEALLTIEAVNAQISIDKNQSTQFVVKYLDEDVTDQATVVNVTGGGYEVLKQNSFTTLRPGNYEFIATYKDYTTMTSALVSAYAGENVSGKYYRRNLIFKFTGTWCTYCPPMGQVIHLLQKDSPDRYIEVAVHDGDQLSQQWAAPFKSRFGIQNLPSVIIDTNKDLQGTEPVKPMIKSLLEKSSENNPTVCGLSMTTKEEAGKITVDVEANVLEENKYTLSVMLLVNGYQYEQSGTNDPKFKQNHVLTAHFQELPNGEDLGQLVKDETVKRQYTLDVPAGIDPSRIEIVAYIENQVSAGVFNTNNAIACPLGESVDYQFEQL